MILPTPVLDEGSRTSSTLAQILLAERHGVTPILEPMPIDHRTQDTKADAVLLIGDRAILPPKETFREIWDLGEEWYNWTGLPFVFATGYGSSGLPEKFRDSPTLQKPFQMATLKSAIEDALRNVAA